MQFIRAPKEGEKWRHTSTHKGGLRRQSIRSQDINPGSGPAYATVLLIFSLVPNPDYYIQVPLIYQERPEAKQVGSNGTSLFTASLERI